MNIKEILKIVDEIEEPSNRFNLGLNNQEALAYFNGFEDTIKAIKQKLNDALCEKEEVKE